MNYDFSKCNNLRWELKDDKGFCRVFEDAAGDSRISFVHSSVSCMGLPEEAFRKSFKLNKLDTIRDSDKEFLSVVKIVPRDPCTYKDWQVGDKVKIDDNGLETVIEVGARINNIVICFNSHGYWGTYTCDNLFDMGKLVLTDYERTLIQVPKYVFNQGDRVLARFDKHSKDDNDKIWYYGKYYGANDSYRYPYSVVTENGMTYNFCECIPYNENTWHLLGTKEDYNDRYIP